MLSFWPPLAADAKSYKKKGKYVCFSVRTRSADI